MELKDVKVGDEVVLQLSRGMGKSDYIFAKVERLTKTLIVVGGKRFRKDTGIQYAAIEQWKGFDRVHLVTDEMRKRVEKTKLKIMAHKLKTYDYQSLVDDNPELLKEIFEKLIKRS